MGIMDMVLAKMEPATPVVVPEFVPTDTSEWDERELLSAIYTKMERTEHFIKVFQLQAQASPILAQFVPKG